jgi:putative DNA primase/helicase
MPPREPRDFPPGVEDLTTRFERDFNERPEEPPLPTGPDGAGEPFIDYTEDGLALLFAARHARDLRYVAVWGKWLQWDVTRWRIERTYRVFDMIRRVCREAAAYLPAKQIKLRAIVAAARTVSAIERMAKADRSIAAVDDQWDPDPDLLQGTLLTVELGRGEARAPERGDYIMTTAACDPDPRMETPLWNAFLDRITAGNVALQLYLQRVCGYCLTGGTHEHALFFLYGLGANGKSTFVETIAGILGGYAINAPMEVFLESQHDRHPTELAMLRGKRLVTATETQPGRRWDEPRIKALTGGDRITARFMRQDFFEYTPRFKLLISGNHKPGLRHVDEAIRRRLHLIPFVVVIPPKERDPGLREKLKAEWPGILHWAVEGCLAWQREGLNPPQVVRDATAEYLASEDAVQTWLEECCELGVTYTAPSAALFGSWKVWAEAVGEKPGSRKALSQRLLDRGFPTWRQGGTGAKGFAGLRLKKSSGRGSEGGLL